MWIALHRSCMRNVSFRTTYLCNLCTRNFVSDFQPYKLPIPPKFSVKYGYNVTYSARRYLFTSLKQYKEIKNPAAKTPNLKKPTKSDVRRLLHLMKPEKWNLAGQLCSFLFE